MLSLILILTIFSQHFLHLQGNDIIIMTAFSPKSHFMYLTPFLEALADRGHSITIFSNTFPENTRNYTTYDIQLDLKLFQDANRLIFHDYRGDPFSILMNLENVAGAKSCSQFVKNKDLRKLVNSKKRFDIAIAFSALEECTFVIGHMLARHVLLINVMRKLLPLYAAKTGIPAPYSFVSHTAFTGFDEMSFSNRFSNAMKSGYHSHYHRDYTTTEKIIRDEYPESKSFRDASDQLTLVFNNGDSVLSEAQPSMPYLVNVGGMHCRPSKPLPEDLKKIVEGSGDNGFILFSMGTVVETNFIGPSITRAFVEAFARLNHTVIWKTNEIISGVTDNVKLVKWTPQQDLLGHPKIRMYITQGGIFGLQEALYHGVPVLGFPVFLDQFSNVGRLEALGCGKAINVFDVTTDKLSSAILEILTNSSFQVQMKKYSNVFRDQTESPLERALYWTEYLLHHDDLTHLKNPTVHLNYAEYFLVDILGFCMIVAALLLGVVKFVVLQFKSC